MSADEIVNLISSVSVKIFFVLLFFLALGLFLQKFHKHRKRTSAGGTRQSARQKIPYILYWLLITLSKSTRQRFRQEMVEDIIDCYYSTYETAGSTAANLYICKELLYLIGIVTIVQRLYMFSITYLHNPYRRPTKADQNSSDGNHQ